MTEIGSASENAALPAAVQMLGLLSGFQLSQALFVVAELGVATALLSGPQEVDDLAAATGADADTLGRIIRYLAQFGVFRASGRTAEITDLGRTLAHGPADSLRSVARYFHQTHYAPFGNLLVTARTGEPAATTFYGRPFFDWVSANPPLAALQNDAMAAFTQNARGDLLDRFALPEGEMVADIGGADGALMVELLAGRPGRRGIVFDLPAVVSGARAVLLAAGLQEQVEAVAGDFFDRVPAADVYVLSAVLQDWGNAPAQRILRNVARAAPAGARLVVIDMVVPEGDAPHPTKMIDITMMGMLGGRQRSLAEWRELLEASEFTLERVVTGSGSYSALEAILARGADGADSAGGPPRLIP